MQTVKMLCPASACGHASFLLGLQCSGGRRRLLRLRPLGDILHVPAKLFLDINGRVDWGRRSIAAAAHDATYAAHEATCAHDATCAADAAERALALLTWLRPDGLRVILVIGLDPAICLAAQVPLNFFWFHLMKWFN